MRGGWFIGGFEPSLYETQSVEVAVKKYRAGESEKRHFHKIATEFTAIIQGSVQMNGQVYVAGDIIKVSPGVNADFQALEDTVTTVVKIPGALNDKYWAG